LGDVCGSYLAGSCPEELRLKWHRMEEEVGGSRTRQKENVQMFGDAPENNVLRRKKQNKNVKKGKRWKKEKIF
jgi:hypothetical protein